MKRYMKNMNMLTKEENEKLKDFKVCVIGCGGLGGYIIEMLGRLGIGNITAVDGDVFDESNLNRQLLSHTNNINCSKALEAKVRMKKVNPLITIKPIHERLTKINGENILKGHDIVIDAVDNVKTKLLIQNICNKLNIPMVHGAIGGWYGQVTTILPGDDTLSLIYGDDNIIGIEAELGNPSFTPGTIASIEVSEALKVLLNKGELLRKKLLYIDLLEHNYFVNEL